MSIKKARGETCWGTNWVPPHGKTVKARGGLTGKQVRKEVKKANKARRKL